MKFNALHHIAIICTNYDLAYQFYVKTLGFSVIRESVRPDKDDRKIDLKVDDELQLELFIRANAPKRVTRPEACGLRHLAFRVDDISKYVMYLQNCGIEYEPVRYDRCTGEKVTFIHDPDGLPIELHE